MLDFQTMSGFGPVTGQHFVCLLSAFCRFQNLEQAFAESYFAITNFTMTVTMQIRKKTLVLLIILIALILIVSVYIFFNRRIQNMEIKSQTPHSENINTNLQSTLNIKTASRL
jgi:uncharacterized membrane protein YidH (DUF202 family)